MSEKLLGEEHPSTATSYNNLAGLYESMGAYEKAEPLYLKALKISEKLLGEEHPSTATSYNNLAGLYRAMGAYEKAEPLYLKALKIRENS
ncbi:MAG: tetratricopeptide repeat protein [Sulfurovum sp.]|nr:tetratricopeptide repeat protein [Sulfurovum sp.]